MRGKTADAKIDGNDNVLRLPDGRLLGYAEYGQRDGIPLLAIHGTPGSRKMLLPGGQAAAQRGIRLIAPDRPGYGLSSAFPGYSFTMWAADMEALLTALGIDRFLLFGVSGGGPFACVLAATMPHRVRGMALVSPVGLFDKEVRETWSMRNHLFFGFLPRTPLLMKLFFPIVRFLIHTAPSLPMRLFIASLPKADRVVLGKPPHAEQLLEAFREGFCTGIEGGVDDLRLFSAPWDVSLEQAETPVIMWQGTNDRMVPAKAAMTLADHLPNVKVITLSGEGHFWIFDHFEDVLDSLLVTVKNNED